MAFVLTKSALAQHPCEAEVNSACPDRPGSEVARCLKDEAEHDSPTTISSECTDFIALNVACADDIAKFCDDAFFVGDTARCLAEWTNQQDLSMRCASVVKWAVPAKDQEVSGSPTDELGMSEQDYAEKRAWQARKKAEREKAIARMQAEAGKTDADRQAELELEQLKKENPAEYKQRLKERQEARQTYEEHLKRKRQLAAAEERQRRAEAGLPEVEDVVETEKERKREERRKRARSMQGRGEQNEDHSWLPTILGVLLVGFVVALGFNMYFKEPEEKND